MGLTNETWQCKGKLVFGLTAVSRSWTSFDRICNYNITAFITQIKKKLVISYN